MIKTIDNFLNNITMYRLVLYYLIFLLTIALFFGAFGILPYNPLSLIFSTFFLLAISWSINIIFAKIYQAPTNIESVYISALILALIIAPVKSLSDLIFLGWAAVWMTASKYILAIGKKHIFNPVAFAVFITALASHQSANWWVGTSSLLPFVILGGILIVRKIRRPHLVYSFFITSFLTVVISSLLKGQSIFLSSSKLIFDSALFFFAFVMLTEPLTTPPTKNLQILYGVLVGFLFAPPTHFGSYYFTPESALIIGNIFSYLVSPKIKLILKLKEKIRLTPDTYDFIFQSQQKINFKPGQYLEWTLVHPSVDDRGNRRYFTIASSPTENNIRMGVKFYPESSSFKKSLLNMSDQNEIVASQLAGDFILPQDKNQKIVFIAGGIGITPFRSMIKYLLDNNEKRDITLFYTNKTPNEIVYQDIFAEAQKKLDIKTIYAVTDIENLSPNWGGKIGRITPEMIKTEVPDYLERNYYLSGPQSMVTAFKKILIDLGIKKNQIKTDYFPGFV